MGTKTQLQGIKWKTALSALFWVLVWQVCSMAIGEALFLPSPLAVARALGGLMGQGSFWFSVGNSLLRIGAGFLLGLVLGILLAVASAGSGLVEVLLRPLMLLIRATPVASFIILALVWVSSRHLGTFASFLMVLPVIYSGTLGGIRAASTALLEMAAVFRIPFWRRVWAIYLPALLPGLLTACELALGLCWKSGVAAEVIGQPRGTIGERLHMAKIFLMTPELFAWTAVIILLSWLFSKAVLFLLRWVAGRWQRGVAHG